MSIFEKRSTVAFIMGCVLILVAGFFASKLSMSSNMESMLSPDNPVVVNLNAFQAHFPDNESAIIVAKGPADRSKDYMNTIESKLLNEPSVLSVMKTIDTAEEMYFQSDDGLVTLLFIRPVLGEDFTGDREVFYSALEEVISDSISAYPELESGITGGAFIQDVEADREAFEGLFSTFFLTLILIILFILISFRRILLPLSTVIPLLGGALLACASAYIIYGSLNMFSVSFAILLLGLGIDYGVHLISHYLESLKHSSISKSVSEALNASGVSVAVGALTTGFAFFAFVLGDFKAFEQMGVISGIGVILLCGMMFLMMPFLMKSFGRAKESKTTSKTGKTGKSNKVIESVIKYPLIAIGIVLLIVITLIPSSLKTKVIGDISKIYPEDMSSIVYAEVLEESFDYNTNSVQTYVDDYDTLVQTVNDLEALETVKGTTSYYNFSQLPKDMIHENLLATYISNSGKYMIEIMPKDNIYDPEIYDLFESSIEPIIGKKPVGMAVLMNEIVSLVTNDIIRISSVCLLIIFILLLVIKRSIIKSIMTMLPVILTLISTLGLMNLFSIDLNIFAIAAFPLIIGIGIDSGIHLMHRLETTNNVFEYGEILPTIKAIFITTVTTIIGFSSLARLNHPGMQSLGLAVSIGMLCCFIYTVVLLPASYILLFSQQKKGKDFQTTIVNE